MATTRFNEVLQHLRSAVRSPGMAAATDPELLHGFTTHRDESAFTEIVRRHGPLVWGVCRRVLGNHHDAEDAFQATFLVLARKAASLVSRELLANWLYGVACNTALKVRAMAVRKRRHERTVADMPEPEVQGEPPWEDLERLLDQELSRLPERFRLVILLCDLQGKTRQEAAQQLGVPAGTVASRLARARALLARRLGVSGGVLGAVLAPVAGPPPALASSTVRAASLFAAGQAVGGAVSIGAATLTEGVLRAMLLMKLKRTMVLLLGFVAFLAVPILLVPAASKQETSTPKQARSAKRAPAPTIPLKPGEKYLFCMPLNTHMADAEFAVLEPPLSNWVKVDGGKGSHGWWNLDHALAIIELKKERGAIPKRGSSREEVQPGSLPLKAGATYFFRLSPSIRRWEKSNLEFVVLEPPSSHWVRMDFGDGTRGWLNLKYVSAAYQMPKERKKGK